MANSSSKISSNSVSEIDEEEKKKRRVERLTINDVNIIFLLQPVFLRFAIGLIYLLTFF
jgi:hypothetical protein